jgi:hypothetical protein
MSVVNVEVDAQAICGEGPFWNEVRHRRSSRSFVYARQSFADLAQSTQELVWVDAYSKLLCFFNPASKVWIYLVAIYLFMTFTGQSDCAF